MAKESFRSDGKSVDVVVTADVQKGDPVLAENWHGIALGNAASGEAVAIEVAEREHLLNVGGSVTAGKGDILYLTAGGALSNTNTDRPAFKVTKAKDANNICWAKILPNLV